MKRYEEEVCFYLWMQINEVCFPKKRVDLATYYSVIKDFTNDFIMRFDNNSVGLLTLIDIFIRDNKEQIKRILIDSRAIESEEK